jgi:hypothetical protein
VKKKGPAAQRGRAPGNGFAYGSSLLSVSRNSAADLPMASLNDCRAFVAKGENLHPHRDRIFTDLFNEWRVQRKIRVQ